LWEHRVQYITEARQAKAIMSSPIRGLSATAEFCLILALCFGRQIVSALGAVVRRRRGVAPRQTKLGNNEVLRIVIAELLALAPALWIGSIRGWSLAAFGWQISWETTATGALLFAALLALSSIYGAILNVLRIEAPKGFILPGATLPFILLLSIVNPVFEEILESGYILGALHHWGLWPAVLASAVFVAFLHVYLGLIRVPLIFLIRVAIGVTYWRWPNFWPLIVAHSLADLWGMLNAQVQRGLKPPVRRPMPGFC
jgi:membrane protease YdiL (CAAX protease family)